MRLVYIATALGLVATPLVITACDTNEGAFEEAGEELDEAGDEIEDAID